MKCILSYVLLLMAANLLVKAEEQTHVAPVEDQVSAASSYSPLQEKHQEKRYVAYNGLGAGYGVGGGGYGAYSGGGYGAYSGGGLAGGLGAGFTDSTIAGGYYSPYNQRLGGLGLGLDGTSSGLYGGGYGSGYGAAGLGYGGAYNSNPYALSYYNSRFGNGYGGYPYGRPGAYGGYAGYGGYNSYPSSYYSSNYANSVVGGGLGALGVPPVGIGSTAGYQYGPGISGTVY